METRLIESFCDPLAAPTSRLLVIVSLVYQRRFCDADYQHLAGSLQRLHREKEPLLARGIVRGGSVCRR